MFITLFIFICQLDHQLKNFIILIQKKCMHLFVPKRVLKQNILGNCWVYTDSRNSSFYIECTFLAFLKVFLDLFTVTEYTKLNAPCRRNIEWCLWVTFCLHAYTHRFAILMKWITGKIHVYQRRYKEVPQCCLMRLTGLFKLR